MKSFKIGPACRVEKVPTESFVWDTATGKWTLKKINKPTLVQNPPPTLDDEQKMFLEIYVDTLVDCIKAKAEARRAQERWDTIRWHVAES